MKRRFAMFLQTVVVLLGVAVFVFLLWEPHVEGRNAHATLFEIYFKDPFLACAYSVSIFFFVALYQAFKLFGDAGRDGAFSASSLNALRTIRSCMLILIGFVATGEVFLFIKVRGEDDIAGGVAMGVFIALFFAGIATAATLFERALRKRGITHPQP
jgi:hypothetical protein